MRSDDDRSADATGIFESFDAVAHLLRNPAPVRTAPAVSRDIGLPGTAPAALPGRGEPAPPRPHDGHLYRPTLRRPMALLHVVDDGREDGEIVRLRGESLLIGRGEGDVVVPHDLLMSPRHARIERLPEGAWRLEDLGSTTGTFVRVDSARLRHERIIQIGATRMRFQEVDLTEAWLVEVAATGVGRRHECHAPASTIGRSGCTILLDDPFVDEVHAEVRRTHGGWRIRNTGINGLWVRIEEPVVMRAPAQFLCGEQRFVFEPLG